MTNIIEVKDVQKSFFGVQVLSNVSFEIEAGTVFGIIGENGAGKSTLMNILGGVLQCDGGELLLNGKKYAPVTPLDATRNGICFIHQELNLFTNMTVCENIFIDEFPQIKGVPFINKKEMRTRTKDLLARVGLEVSPVSIVETLSPGERQLVEIAKALKNNPQVIIFDEPTTSLTYKETEKLFDLIRQLKDQGTTIIYISHILDDVLMLCDRIMCLKDGKVADIGEKKDFTINRMVTSMVGVEMKSKYPDRDTLPLPEKAMEIEGISQTRVLRDISFSLHKQEVLGIFGLMGSGRTELLRIIFGLDGCKTGSVYLNGKKLDSISTSKNVSSGLAFVTEDRRGEGLMMNSSLNDNISLVDMPNFTNKLGFVKFDGLKDKVKKIASELKIKYASLDRSVPKNLSGGNQQKVVLAKWLMVRPDVLIIDEPTRGIDVGAKYEVYSVLNDLVGAGKSVLMVSSEVEELIGMCDRIIVMSRGEIITEFARKDFDKTKIIAAAFRQGIETKGA